MHARCRPGNRRRIGSPFLGGLPGLLLILTAGAPAQDVLIVEEGDIALEAAEVVLEEEATSAEKPGEAGGAGHGPRSRGVPPPEFAGPAMPQENTGALAQVERAREFFEAKEWSRGLDILDELLSARPDAGTAPAADREKKAASPPPPPAGVVRVAGAAGPVLVQARPAAPGGGGGGAEKKSEGIKKPARIVFTGDGIHYVPLRRELRRLLLELPAEGRDVYRSTYEPTARSMQEELLELSFPESLDALDDLSSRYPLTETGLGALETLADRALDLGLAERAADAYRELLARREFLLPGAEPATRRAQTAARAVLLTKAAVASFLAGRNEQGEQFLARLARDHPDDTVTIRGEPIRGAEIEAQAFLRALRERPHASGAFRWSAPMGRHDHAEIPLAAGLHPPLGSRARWIHEFPGAASRKKSTAVPVTVKRRVPVRQSSLLQAFPATQVATVEGVVLVRSGSWLVALDSVSGKIRWRADPLAVRGGSSGAASPAGFQHLGSSTISLAGDLAMITDQPSAPRHDSKGKLTYAPNRVFAYDLHNGKLKWRVGGADGFPKTLRSLFFTAPPTRAGRDLLVVPATQGDGPFLVGLTLTGKLRWVERLYNYNTGYLQRHRNAVSQGASLAVSEGLAVYAPGHGVVSAVEAESGRLRWITRYRTQSYSTSGETVWAPSQPVIAGDRVVVAPYDSRHLVVLDLHTGKTLWDRDFSGDRYQLVGADRELIYIAGSRLEAIEVATGKTRYESEAVESAAGRGFVTADRVYLPLEGEIAVLEKRSGKILSRIGFTDSRVAGLVPGNLALVAAKPEAGAPETAASSTRLVALGSWGVAVIQPQSESWQEIEKGSKLSFERARLLKAEGNYDESIRLLESLLKASRSESSIGTARRLLVETAREAARRRRDAQPIARILASPALELEETLRTSLELEQARILEETSPADAAALYREIAARARAGRTRERVFTPDGIEALPEEYCAESLRQLTVAGKIEEPGEERRQARESLAALGEASTPPGEPGSETAVERAREILTAIARDRPYLAAAAEALARLAGLAALGGDRPGTLRYLERLLSDYPKLRGVPQIQEMRRRYRSALEKREPAPPSLAGSLADRERKWRQRFWQGIDQGFLVETLPGSRPLRNLLVLKQGKLRVLSSKGEVLGEVPLPGFPDVEQAKAALKSHIEEPAWILSRGEEAVLFTAAGVYQLRFPPAGESSAASEDAGDHPGEDAGNSGNATPPLPGVGWHHNFPHAIDSLHSRMSRGWGWSSLASVPGNLFPKFLLGEPQTEAHVLKPDGEVMVIDLKSGKVRVRFRPAGVTPVGDPAILGHRLVSSTIKPPGLVAYDMERQGGGKDPFSGEGLKVSLEKSGSTLYRAALIPGMVAVLDHSGGTEVQDLATRRVLWKEEGSRSIPALVRVTGAEVWRIDPAGFLRSFSIRGGRIRWSLPVPPRAMPIRTFFAERDGTESAGEGDTLWIALAVEGNNHQVLGHQPFTQSGKQLVLLKVTENGDKLREVRIGNAGVTYRGRRLTAEEQWLLVYNEAAGDRWFTRVATLDPRSGEHRVLFEAPIAGKGTGLPPRLAFIEGDDGAVAVGLGNAEGFGIFEIATGDDGASEDAGEEDSVDGSEEKDEGTERIEPTSARDAARARAEKAAREAAERLRLDRLRGCFKTPSWLRPAAVARCRVDSNSTLVASTWARPVSVVSPRSRSLPRATSLGLGPTERVLKHPRRIKDS